MEREARLAVTAEPNSAYAYRYVVDALAARRVPVDAVRDAGPAATPAQAREAVDALSRFAPLPRSVGNPGVWTAREEAIGRAYLVSGDLDQAIEHLRLAAGACGVLPNLHLYVRAHEELGEALAAQGDTAGACAAYGVVLGYWGNAKPRSVTADRARDGMRRIDCGK